MGISNKKGGRDVTDSKAAIFQTLDDLQFGPEFDGEITPLGELGSVAGAEAKAIAGATSNKAYRRLTSAGNVTTYSMLGLLHSCPRKFELEKYKANSPSAEIDTGTVNLDFAFGHAVGAGIQTYAATGNLTAALLATWLSWRAPYDAEKTDKRGNPSGKSLTWACYAVEKFSYFWQRELGDWEVVRLVNGKKAVELEFAVDFQNGYFHFGHIDVVLQHKQTKQLAVWEGKTTGFEDVDEALYANSSQALGYSVVVDAIAKQLDHADGADYEVLYIVYSSSLREFQLLPFGKSRAQRAEWMQDILLDHSNIAAYQKLNFFPKRGEACYDGRWRSRCPWFGTCTLQTSSIFPNTELRKLENIEDIETVDFKFTLAELVKVQKGE